MPFEIWQHRTSGDRYLVINRAGRAEVAAGPLLPGEDPTTVLRRHANQHHNAWALLDMRRHPDDYRRELTRDHAGQVREVAPGAEHEAP